MKKVKVRLRPIVSRINLPTVLKTAKLPGDSVERLFIATQVGEIFYIGNGDIRTFLDIRANVIELGASSGGYDERGLFTGLTLANILGVLIGTFLGQAYGWRSTFWSITIIGIIALIGIAILVPKVKAAESSLLQELGVLRRPAVHIALLMTVFGFGGVFTAFTYITPILVDITGFAPKSVSYILVLFGIGITIGNIYGGKLADKKLLPSLIGILFMLSIVLALFSITDQNKILTLFTVFVFGIFAFGTVPGLQLHMLNTAKEAPTLASTLNIAAFNLGNALGAYIGGVVIDLKIGGGLPAIPLFASLVTVVGIFLTLWGAQQQKRNNQQGLNH